MRIAKRQLDQVQQRGNLPPAVRGWLESILAVMPFSISINCWDCDRVLSPRCSPHGQPQLALTINHPGVLKQLILSQEPLILVEAYINGRLSFTGNMAKMVELGVQLSHNKFSYGKALLAYCHAVTLPNLNLDRQDDNKINGLAAHSRERDQMAISHH